ncbi:hypothetical protein ASZ78_000011, partial [Callipepla squamata]
QEEKKRKSQLGERQMKDERVLNLQKKIVEKAMERKKQAELLKIAPQKASTASRKDSSQWNRWKELEESRERRFKTLQHGFMARETAQKMAAIEAARSGATACILRSQLPDERAEEAQEIAADSRPLEVTRIPVLVEDLMHKFIFRIDILRNTENSEHAPRKRRGGSANSRQAQKRSRLMASTTEMASEGEPIELEESAGEEVVDLTCESSDPVVVDLTHNDSIVIVEENQQRRRNLRLRGQRQSDSCVLSSDDEDETRDNDVYVTDKVSRELGPLEDETASSKYVFLTA